MHNDDIDDQCQKTDSGLRFLCQSSEYVMSITGESYWTTHLDFFHQGLMSQYMGVVRGRHLDPELTPEDYGIDSLVITWDLSFTVAFITDHSVFARHPETQRLVRRECRSARYLPTRKCPWRSQSVEYDIHHGRLCRDSMAFRCRSCTWSSLTDPTSADTAHLVE